VPNASNLNYSVGHTIAKAVFARVGVGGKVCLYNFGATHLLADVTGYFPVGAAPSTDSSPGSAPVTSTASWRSPSLAEPVWRRAPQRSLLNVTIDAARGGGFVTVFPCGAALPTAGCRR
jgi:hypothetical protein